MESQNSSRRVTRRYNVSSAKSPISISPSEHESDNETEFLSSSYTEDVFSNSRVITSSIKQRKAKAMRHNTSDYSSEENEESSFDKRHSSNRNGNAIHSDEGDLSEHKPYKLYKEAGEYWNKYPKTDYTYSRYSPHRRELEPGVIVMPNMSRRSIHNEDNSLSDSNRSNYVLEKTRLSRNYYSNSDMPKRRLEQFWGRDEVDYTIKETLIQKILRITRITLIYTVITNYFHSFTNRGYKIPNKPYITTYKREERWYHKIWNVIISSFSKIGSAYYTLLGSVLLFDSWLLRRINRTTLSEESSQNTANQISEDRWKILRRLGYAFLILALLLLGINYGTNKDLNEYISELPELPELLSIPTISIPKPISEYAQSSQDTFMEAFEYTKLATNEYYNELYKFFLSEYMNLNKTESGAEQVIQPDRVQSQEDQLFIDDTNNLIDDNYDPFNDENIEL